MAVEKLPLPPVVGLGRQRKIALIGNAPSLVHAPWSDPTWEIWSHTSTQPSARRVDRFFELHPKSFWMKGKNWHRDYVGWLKTNTIPILMQEKYRDVPASVKYPRDRVLAEFRPYFTSQSAWMIALALTEGVTHLGFFGVEYKHYSEYATQRSGCEYWMGIAEGRGVQLVLPPRNPLLQTPSRLYGYESHDEGTLHHSYRYESTPKPKDDKTPPPVVPEVAATVEGSQLMDIGEPIAWERSGLPQSEWKD